MEEKNTEKTEESENLLAEAEEVAPLDPPLFTVKTEINGEIQMEASMLLRPKAAKFVSYLCIMLVAASLGVLIWQYVVTKAPIHLIMGGMVILALVYLFYAYYSMPKRALRRWEESIQRTYGGKSLHLYTEFYRLSLAQTLEEDGTISVKGYSELSDLRESEHLFLLRHSKQRWYFINKDGFTTGTPDEFRTFITKAIFPDRQ